MTRITWWPPLVVEEREARTVGRPANLVNAPGSEKKIVLYGDFLVFRDVEQVRLVTAMRSPGLR